MVFSIACPSGKYSVDCQKDCHCIGGIECDNVEGHCTDNRCLKNWIGYSCQIRMPEYYQITSDTYDISLSLSSAWKKRIYGTLEGVIKKYQISYLSNNFIEMFNQFIIMHDLTILNTAYYPVSQLYLQLSVYEVNKEWLNRKFSIISHPDFTLLYNVKILFFVWGEDDRKSKLPFVFDTKLLPEMVIKTKPGKIFEVYMLFIL